MDDVESLTHTLWECKYHVVWIPKYRKKVMFCKLREPMGTLLKDLLGPWGSLVQPWVRMKR